MRNFMLAWALLFVAACIVIVICTRKPHNKRIGLPAPRPDSRSSIDQFKRMHTQ